MLEKFRSTNCYKLFGILSLMGVIPASWLYIWALGPRGFGSLIGLCSVGFAHLLIILSIVACFEMKSVKQISTNLICDIGSGIGLVFLCGFVCILFIPVDSIKQILY